jgi:beta-N-acetylhexosaminidase
VRVLAAVALAALVAAAVASASGGSAQPVASDEVHHIGKPHVVWRPIPFDKRRKREMKAYAQRHYGYDTYRLIDPQVVVEHYTANESFSATYNTFAPDQPDPELHELPGVCAHSVIDKDGTIYQLVSLDYMCRHTVGLNYTAVGIEHVGESEPEILGNRRQLRSSLALTRWLHCSRGIFVRDVIGHNESLESPYHRERVKSLRHQTHGDWTHHYMRIYRRKLRALGGC